MGGNNANDTSRAYCPKISITFIRLQELCDYECYIPPTLSFPYNNPARQVELRSDNMSKVHVYRGCIAISIATALDQHLFKEFGRNWWQQPCYANPPMAAVTYHSRLKFLNLILYSSPAL